MTEPVTAGKRRKHVCPHDPAHTPGRHQPLRRLLLWAAKRPEPEPAPCVRHAAQEPGRSDHRCDRWRCCREPRGRRARWIRRLPRRREPGAGASIDPVPALTGIADLAATVQPAVVQINVGSEGQGGSGSGFIISEDGYIVTNNHVAGPAGEDGTVEVVFPDGATATGTLVGADAGYDLAVVKVERNGLPTLEFGSSEAVRVGDLAVAIGSPLGLQGTVTSGIVSALERPVTAGGGGSTSFINAIQTDAAINPGNSGGPLVNGSGEVIGVNTAIASLSAVGGAAGSIGLGFAIPIDTAERVVNELIETGSSSTPVIGVQLDTTFSGPGAKVGQVTPGSGADQAGIQDGDVITA